jgi:Ca2+-transporting ATPase
VVSIVLESTMSKHKETGWVSGTAILFAVLLVSTVTSLNNWSKERQFRKLEATDRSMVSVTRDGALLEVDVVDVVVGDIVGIRTGDLICADGVFIEGSNLSCDESAMTGESLAVKKSEAKPFFLSGTKAIEGEGKMVVTSVGVHTEIGRIKSSIDEESGDTQTPLEEKLEQMAKDIGKVGLVVAVMTVIVSVIWWLVSNMRKPKIERFTRDENLKLIDFFILGVTILVVAIPEGLPLAVTISLAYSMQRMTKDKCLVRKLAACETCGGVTNICSDKTGTLTENNMTACELLLAGKHHKTLPGKDEVAAGLLDPLTWGIVVNSTAFFAEGPKDPKGPKVWSGNKTEMALLVMLEKRYSVCTGPPRAGNTSPRAPAGARSPSPSPPPRRAWRRSSRTPPGARAPCSTSRGPPRSSSSSARTSSRPRGRSRASAARTARPSARPLTTWPTAG